MARPEDAEAPEPAPARPVARVVLVDPAGAVLLLGAHDPAEPDRRFWFTPGGGLEEGESHEDAARREVFEETGHRLFELGPERWRRRTAFWFDGTYYDQEEVWFVVRCPHFAPSATGFTELEAATVTDARWWTPVELAHADEDLYPAELPGLLTAWLGDPRRRVAHAGGPA